MAIFKFNRVTLLESVRRDFGKLKPAQLDGLGFLLGRIESDDRWQCIEQIAYFLATAWHETARTLKPVTEYGGKKYFDKYDTGKLAKRLGNTPEKDGDGYLYRGRGYVQNTGRGNASKTGIALSGREYEGIGVVNEMTFVRNPELLLNPAVSYDDAVDGMFAGRYTGKKLTNYVAPNRVNYKEARRVINGQDAALLIAGYAMAFERALSKSRIEAVQTPAIDKVLTPIGPSDVPEQQAAESKFSVKDVTKHISTDSVKTVAPRLAVKAGTAGVGGAVSLWQLGLHGKVLLIGILIILAVVVGVGVYEVIKHRNWLKSKVFKFLKGGDN